MPSGIGGPEGGLKSGGVRMGDNNETPGQVPLAPSSSEGLPAFLNPALCVLHL